jgi:hypothetical protein
MQSKPSVAGKAKKPASENFSPAHYQAASTYGRKTPKRPHVPTEKIGMVRSRNPRKKEKHMFHCRSPSDAVVFRSVCHNGKKSNLAQNIGAAVITRTFFG